LGRRKKQANGRSRPRYGGRRDDMNGARRDAVKPAPFDTARLDALLEDEGIDVLVAISKCGDLKT
jgi:hypothetical protein